MDAHLAAAARALAGFDPVEALRWIAQRKDPPGLLLRGVALAQLGEFGAAQRLLAKAGKLLPKTDVAARARCLAAEAEVALASRELDRAGRGFDAAARALDAAGDAENAAFVRLQQARRAVLLGDLEGAEEILERFEGRPVPARTAAVHELIGAELAVRRLNPKAAREALTRGLAAARFTKLPPLVAEFQRALSDLKKPVARLTTQGNARPVTLDDVEAALRSGDLVIDEGRLTVRLGRKAVSLASRPVLFQLIATLGEASPGDVAREALIARVFGGRADESHRVRLRVEVGRLRKLLRGVATVDPTERGYALVQSGGGAVSVLSPPAGGDAGRLLGLLSDGEQWSTSALATAIGSSQRAVQRALAELAEGGKVHALGRGRAQRWVASLRSEFATTLLLSASPARG